MNLDELFDISAQTRQKMPHSILLPGTVDTHVHCRPKKTGQMGMVVKECAAEHEAIVDIPNIPGMNSVEALTRRREQIIGYIPSTRYMHVGVTPLVNDHTDPNMIRYAFEHHIICGIKVFWQGVSNDYGNSISSADALIPIIKSVNEALRGRKLLVTLHAECLNDYNGVRIPIKDREFWCIQNEVTRLMWANPESEYVIRHISDGRTIEWIHVMRSMGFKVYGELSPQYFILIDDDIFTGEDGHAALQCNCVFWPRPKNAWSQKKIQEAGLSGLSHFHIGTDYAMHLEDPLAEKGVKINNKGIAVGGLNFLPRVAKSVMIDFYAGRDKLDLLPAMLSTNAAKLYDFDLSGRQYEYVREDWVVDEHHYGYGPGSNEPNIRSRNFLAGHTMHWKRAA